MLLQPTLYIFFAALSLAQFPILYSAVLHYLHLLSKSEYTSGFAIYFATITGNLKGVLGEFSQSGRPSSLAPHPVVGLSSSVPDTVLTSSPPRCTDARCRPPSAPFARRAFEHEVRHHPRLAGLHSHRGLGERGEAQDPHRQEHGGQVQDELRCREHSNKPLPSRVNHVSPCSIYERIQTSRDKVEKSNTQTLYYMGTKRVKSGRGQIPPPTPQDIT